MAYQDKIRNFIHEHKQLFHATKETYEVLSSTQDSSNYPYDLSIKVVSTCSCGETLTMVETLTISGTVPK